MNRYVLRRETITGANTVKTTNPSEVERWLWESLSQGSTLSVTVKVEDVPRPEPKAKPQCEGQRTVFDEPEPGGPLLGFRQSAYCKACGFGQCPKVGVRPVGCSLGPVGGSSSDSDHGGAPPESRG